MTMVIRHPTVADAPAVLRIVMDSRVLDPNSAYAYVLLFEHFAATCAVVEARGELVGFVTGYRVPTRPDVQFVWQIGVYSQHRGSGLGTAMILWLLGARQPAPARFIEATVTPSNSASRGLFLGIARELRTGCSVEPAFPAKLLGEGHEPEELYRIGPIDRSPP